MTNPKSTQLGIYGLPKRVMCLDTGFELETVNECWTGWRRNIALLSSLEYLILKGGKPVRDCLEQELERVEQPALVLETYQHMKS